MKTVCKHLSGAITIVDKTRAYKIFKAGIKSAEIGKKRYDVIRVGRILNITITRLSPVFGEPEGYVTNCQLELSKQYYQSKINEGDDAFRFPCRSHVAKLMRVLNQLSKGHTTNNFPMELKESDYHHIRAGMECINESIRHLEKIKIKLKQPKQFRLKK